MGLYDTFVVPKFRCPHCGHEYDAAFQTKDFGDDFTGGSMERVTLGQDLRKPVRRLWLWYSTTGSFAKKISKATALRLAKDKKHYEVSGNGYGYQVYKILKPTQIFFACKNRVIKMGCTCPKCDKWIEVKGVIKDWKFRGVQKTIRKRKKNNARNLQS